MSHVTEWTVPFLWHIFNIHQSGVLTALFGCYMAGATWSCCSLSTCSVHTIQLCTSLWCHFIWSHICRVHVGEQMMWGLFFLFKSCGLWNLVLMWPFLCVLDFNVTLPLTMNETLKWLSLLPILMQNHSGCDCVALSIVPPPPPGISAPASTSPETTQHLSRDKCCCLSVSIVSGWLCLYDKNLHFFSSFLFVLPSTSLLGVYSETFIHHTIFLLFTHSRIFVWFFSHVHPALCLFPLVTVYTIFVFKPCHN